MACIIPALLVLCVSLFAAVVSPAPASRDKRSDDTLPLEAVMTSNSQHIQQQAAQLIALQHKLSHLELQLQQIHDKAFQHIGFHARLRNGHHVTLNQGETLKFDLVLTNQGNGYDITTGIFTAPMSGLYAFLISTMGNDADHDGHVYLKVNSNVVVFVDDGSSIGTGHGVFHMNQGDQAWVEGNHGSTFVYSFDTTFTGFLVTPDF